MEISVTSYSKEELRNRTYQTPEISVDNLLTSLSDWFSDFIIEHSKIMSGREKEIKTQM